MKRNTPSEMRDIDPRALELHHNELVLDYYPLGIPLVIDDELREMVKHRVEEGANGNAVVFEILDTCLSRMEGPDVPQTSGQNDPRSAGRGESTRKRLEQAIARSGVDCAAVTLGDPARPLSDFGNITDSISWWERMIQALPILTQVSSASEIEAAARAGRYGLLYVLQDGGAVEEDLDHVEELYNRGVRIIQLTYNRANSLGAGCAEDPAKGLTELGREAIARMKRAGIAVDLSHCNRQTTLEGIAACAESFICEMRSGQV